MASMKRSCLLWTAIYVALGGLLTFWFLLRFPEAPPDVSPRLPPLPFRLALAAGAGLIGAIPASLALAGMDGIRTRLGERRQLLAAAGHARPIDGTYQPIVGRLAAEGPLLAAPLTGRPCLAYRYCVSHRSGGKSSTRVTDAEGFALSPCRVDTVTGPVRLQAFMEFEFTGDSLDDAAARERLRAYLPTVSLFKPSLNLRRNYQESLKHLLDNDGSIRFDSGSPNAPETASRFEEQILQAGDEVAVFGIYSAVRRAVIPDPAAPMANIARLRKGPVAGIARGFVGQAIASGLAGLFFGALAWGLILLFFRHAAGF